MFFYLKSRNRPYHLGPFPLETLPRDDSVTAVESERPPCLLPNRMPNNGILS